MNKRVFGPITKYCSIKRFIRRYSIKRIIKRSVWAKLFIAFIVLFFIGVVGMYYCENYCEKEKGKEEKNFENFGQAMLSGWLYVLTGFEDRTPKTTGGKLFATFVFFAGLVVLGTAVGLIAPIFLKKEVKMPKGMQNHIVICNWNEGGDKIIKEMSFPLKELDKERQFETKIVVITDKKVNEEELRKSKEYERVFFVRSDPTLHSVLKVSRVHLTRSVVILADRESQDPDAKTALIALAITKGLCKGSSKKPHIVAEVVNHRKIEHLMDAGVDEYICATDYGFGILAQCTIYPKLSNAYQQLLKYSKKTNELYLIPHSSIPDELWEKRIKGKPFSKVAAIFNESRDPDNPAVLVGVKREGRIILNPMENWKGPQKEKFEEFKEKDDLIVMAFDYPDLSKITPK
ncbi:ion transporter [candidate division WOR-3 bacterium]|nr:ion transporter [candidate division WOR-3 bacterium]